MVGNSVFLPFAYCLSPLIDSRPTGADPGQLPSPLRTQDLTQSLVRDVTIQAWGDYETCLESQSVLEGKRGLEPGAVESQARSPLWPAPPESTQHKDPALAWDQEMVSVSWEIHPKDSRPQGKTQVRGTQRFGNQGATCMNQAGPLSFLWVVGLPYHLAFLPARGQAGPGESACRGCDLP